MQPLCLDRWRRTEGGRWREGRLVLIAVNHAVRWEDRGGRRTAVNFDPLPGRRDAGVCVCVCVCVCVRVNNLERRAEFQQAQGQRERERERETEELTENEGEEVKGWRVTEVRDSERAAVNI